MKQYHIQYDSIQQSLDKEEREHFYRLLSKIEQHEKDKMEQSLVRLQDERR